MKIRTLIIIAITSFVISCGQVKKPIVVELPLPPAIPEHDTLTQADLECLSGEALDKVILLDLRRKTLRSIILTTHKPK